MVALRKRKEPSLSKTASVLSKMIVQLWLTMKNQKRRKMSTRNPLLQLLLQLLQHPLLQLAMTRPPIMIKMNNVNRLYKAEMKKQRSRNFLTCPMMMIFQNPAAVSLSVLKIRHHLRINSNNKLQAVPTP